jgi:hypothetical protein
MIIMDIDKLSTEFRRHTLENRRAKIPVCWQMSFLTISILILKKWINSKKLVMTDIHFFDIYFAKFSTDTIEFYCNCQFFFKFWMFLKTQQYLRIFWQFYKIFHWAAVKNSTHRRAGNFLQDFRLGLDRKRVL